MATKYIAIIDAGSTSSRLPIYSYGTVEMTVGDPKRYEKPMKFVKLKVKVDNPNDKGISNVGDGDQAMRSYLQPMLDAGVKALTPTLIPQNGAGNEWHKKVPLYIMATAGMRDDNGRILPSSVTLMRRAWDAVQALRAPVAGVGSPRRVFEIGHPTFNDALPGTYPNNLKKDAFSFVVPAEDEGIYAWVALNYGRNVPGRWLPGALELGGKSMQVAYMDATDPKAKAVCLWKSRYYVKSQSWVLGAEESRRAAVEDKVIAEAKRYPGRDVYNPCLPSFQPSLIETYSSIGTGDFAKCLAMAGSYLNTKVDTPLSSLDIQHLARRFYGTSTFLHTYKFFAKLKLYDEDTPYDQERFRSAVDKYCNSSWLDPSPWMLSIQGGVDSERDWPHIHKHCFAAAWMITLFHDRKGFQLGDEKIAKLIHFPIQPELDDRSSWTIGAAIIAARHGNPKVFCSGTESNGPYPPPPNNIAGLGNRLVESTHNRLTVVSIPSSPPASSSVASSTPVIADPIVAVPVVVAPVIDAQSTPNLVDSALPVGAPSTLTTVSDNHLPSLSPLGIISDPRSTFLAGLTFGALLIALVLTGYRRLSTRRAAIQLPITEGKDGQPAVTRPRPAFFDKAKGAIFLSGEDNA
ncbi:hypothetical protein DXG01_003455 [Tephrocybe rancida]|nr:hypothetical protein DXG01_003455 [Tephrocybe rancida]